MRNCNFLYISNVPFLYVGNSYIQVGAFLKKNKDLVNLNNFVLKLLKQSNEKIEYFNSKKNYDFK